MAYASDAAPTRLYSRSLKLGFAPDDGDVDNGRPPRDLKKAFLVAGLGILSWVATYVGMLELIEANMGELPLAHKIIIGFSVAMLMTMIIWLLDQMFSPIGTFTRLCYVAGYIFLTIISVGFGFGFYWKVLESRSESSRSAESAVTQVQSSLHAASTRLEQLNATLVQLAALSHEKAEIERIKGTSCPNSKPGDGPRRKMRDEDASRFSFASQFVQGRVGAVKGDMAALDGDLAKIASDDKSIVDAKTGTRNEFMKGLSRKLDMTVTGFNAFRSDPQLKQLRADLAERGEKTTFGDAKNGGFVCPDPQLQQALRGAVRAIDQLPVLEKPTIAAVEGSEATIEAFRRLTATFYGLLSFKLPPSADELRELQQKAVQSVEGGAAQRATDMETAGLSKRDYVPLAIAIFVDICLLLVSIGRPMNRLHSLVPKMRAAEQGPVIEILSRFNEIHRDPQIRQNFEVFRHVVFDFHGDYYVAVPLDTPYRPNPRGGALHQAYGARDAQDLQHEAHLLSNLFTSFEKERIFKRVYSPFLTTSAIQRKLMRQGSKFAACEAFRVYRFRDGAWSEIILGAVMGAARRSEEAKRRREMQEADALGRREPAFAGLRGFRMPEFMGATTREPLWEPPPPKTDQAKEPDAAAAASSGSKWFAAMADVPADHSYAAKHGPYSQSAWKELNGWQSMRSEPKREPAAAANSNTGPAASKASGAAGPAASRPAVADKPPADIATAASGEPAKPAREATAKHVEATETGARPDDTVVVFKRETATVTVPAGKAASGELMSRLGETLAKAATAASSEVKEAVEFVPVQGELALSDEAPASALHGALIPIDDDVDDRELTSDVASDPATSDAIAMADRLRPARWEA